MLQRYPGRVTLAAETVQSQLRQASLIQLTQPQRLFWTKPMSDAAYRLEISYFLDFISG